MGDVSEHLSSTEVACHDGCGLKSIHPDTVAAFEELRELVGGPIHVNCGCRCKIHNDAVRGEVHSFHLPAQHCRALDIVVPGKTVNEMYVLALKVPAFKNGGIGRYYQSGFIHVDTRPWVARWEG